jgi:hypothetical protein
MQVSRLRATVEMETRSAAMPQYYEIKIKGHLDPRWSDWFEGLELADLEGGETMLSGLLADQAALHGLLERIRDLNLTLISVTSGVPSAPISHKEEQGE